MCLAYVIVAITTEAAGYSVQRSNLQNQLFTRAKTDAAILAAGSILPLSYPKALRNVQTEQTLLHSLSGAEGVSAAEVIGAGGGVLASTNPAEVGKKLTPPSVEGSVTQSQTNGDVIGIAPAGSRSQYIGYVRVVLSGASVEGALHNSLVVETLVRSLGLLLFVLLSLVISRYILGPLTTLARAARSIRRGDLAVRIPAAGRTELSTVADAFNDMAGALEHRIRHLTFLAEAGALLPNAFRDEGDVRPILREFCEKLEASGACLVRSEDLVEDLVFCSVPEGADDWLRPAVQAARGADRPAATVQDGGALMVVPVFGSVFVTTRATGHPFALDEQQVITNFAFQIGIAADNARLFASQQEALKVKDQFLSIVSHELRTPLTTIKGYAQMLRRKLADDEESERFADAIDSQTSRLSRLVDDLLDVTRFSRSQFELKQQRTDLHPLLEDVVARFRLVTAKHTLVLQADSDSLEGEWDRDRLEQVLNNLLSNAVKYSPDGGTISVSAQRDDGMAIISVRDQGQGIPEEDQKQLFERFFRGSAEHQDIQGLGLGLYVTRRIVEAHGGQITLRSRVGEGSEFTVSLPLLRQSAMQGVAQESVV
jgi:signal transduction histidine kinase